MATLPARRSNRGSGRNLAVVNPTREFEDIYDRMGQLMNLAFGSMMPMPTVAADLPWVPLGDISETDDAYVVRVDLPGVSKDQIDIQLQDRELVITGEIPDQQEQQGQGQSQGQGQGQQQDNNERQHRTQRPTGRFEFHAILPGEVNADGVNAQLKDGVLTLNIPKSEAAKPHRIEVSG